MTDEELHAARAAFDVRAERSARMDKWKVRAFVILYLLFCIAGVYFFGEYPY